MTQSDMNTKWTKKKKKIQNERCSLELYSSKCNSFWLFLFSYALQMIQIVYEKRQIGCNLFLYVWQVNDMRGFIIEGSLGHAYY